jgi:hypothetical protein
VSAHRAGLFRVEPSSHVGGQKLHRFLAGQHRDLRAPGHSGVRFWSSRKATWAERAAKTKGRGINRLETPPIRGLDAAGANGQQKLH